MDFFNSLIQREVFIGFAVAGAILVTIGSFLMNRSSVVNPRISKLILRTGYAFTCASVAIFIAAGYMSNE